MTDFTSRPGAVGSPPQHYGNPLGEQRALAAGTAVVELADRAVITVTGPDRLTWLDSLTSQSLTHLAPGDSAETLLLDPQGHLEHAMRVIDDGITTWLLVDAAEGPALAAWLDRMRFMLRVEIADRSADFVTIGALDAAGSRVEPVETSPANNPLPLPAATPNGVPLVWVDPWREVVAGGHQYATASEHPAADWSYREVLIAASEPLAEVPVAGTLALEALRIAAWRPRLTSEADEKSIPHELDWLRSAVHLAKGCYRGQETVAKVHNLGHPPRRLVMLHLDGSEGLLPAAGDPVLWEKTARGGGEAVAAPATSAASPDATAASAAASATSAASPDATAASALSAASASAEAEPLAGPTEVGHITSVALHHELGPIALAVIKRSVDPSATLIVRGAETSLAAAQETIVPTDAGAEANVPRLPRLGAVRRGA